MDKTQAAIDWFISIADPVTRLTPAVSADDLKQAIESGDMIAMSTIRELIDCGFLSVQFRERRSTRCMTLSCYVYKIHPEKARTRSTGSMIP